MGSRCSALSESQPRFIGRRTDGPLSDDGAERMLRDPVEYFAGERERVRGDFEAEMAREEILGRQLRRRPAALTIRRLFGICSR